MTQDGVLFAVPDIKAPVQLVLSETASHPVVTFLSLLKKRKHSFLGYFPESPIVNVLELFQTIPIILISLFFCNLPRSAPSAEDPLLLHPSGRSLALRRAVASSTAIFDLLHLQATPLLCAHCFFDVEPLRYVFTHSSSSFQTVCSSLVLHLNHFHNCQLDQLSDVLTCHLIRRIPTCPSFFLLFVESIPCHAGNFLLPRQQQQCSPTQSSRPLSATTFTTHFQDVTVSEEAVCVTKETLAGPMLKLVMP